MLHERWWFIRTSLLKSAQLNDQPNRDFNLFWRNQ